MEYHIYPPTQPALPLDVSYGNGLPPTDEFVIAITRSFRCLAYLEKDGSWRSAYSRALLPEVIAWHRLE